MQEFEEDYYAILGVEPQATLEEIRAAYIALAKKLHPDRFPNEPEKKIQAQAEFAKVTRAHEVIADVERRAEYDAFRKLLKERQAMVTVQGTPQVGTAEAQAQAAVLTEATKLKWAERHLARADEMFRKQKNHEAETAVKEALRLIPTDPRFHNKLAEIYLARGWKTLANTEIQTVLRLDPKNHDAKMLDMKLKSLTRQDSGTGPKKPSGKTEKKGFLDQIKEMLTKKI
jgi:curved DNA-binding protein CbpA